MKEFLGDLIVRLVPVALPAVMIWSFLINHGMAPGGGSSKGEKKPDKKSEDTANKTEE